MVRDMVERVLLLLNQSSGTGHAAAVPIQLVNEMRTAAGPLADIDVEVVGDHPTARRVARWFLEASSRPAR
jgi:hypothetical protein